MADSSIVDMTYVEAVQGIKEEWLKGPISNEWYNYIVGLPLPLQVTYLTVVLHNQVFNGGFHQYFTNAYGQFARETIKALREIKSFRKAKILEKALAVVNADGYNDEVLREKLLNFQIEALFKTDELDEPLDMLNMEYDNCEKEDVEQLLTNYLQR